MTLFEDIRIIDFDLEMTKYISLFVTQSTV